LGALILPQAAELALLREKRRPDWMNSAGDQTGWLAWRERLTTALGLAA